MEQSFLGHFVFPSAQRTFSPLEIEVNKRHPLIFFFIDSIMRVLVIIQKNRHTDTQESDRTELMKHCV